MKQQKEVNDHFKIIHNKGKNNSVCTIS